VSRPGVGVSLVKVYRFVRARCIALDPPTVREVQEHLGCGAIESVRRHLVNLVAEGRLQHHPGKARGYRWPGANVSRAVLGAPPDGPTTHADGRTCYWCGVGLDGP
jgi:hypothetical protein